MNISHLTPKGRMSPPSRKHWIHKPNAKPPQAPIKYFVVCQKKMDMPPPAIPATKDDKTNIPRKVVPGGFIECKIPNLTIRAKQMRDRV